MSETRPSPLSRERIELCRRRKLTRREFAGLMLLQAGRCAACRERLQADHIIDEHLTPLDQGGTNALGNRALFCRACARAKTRKDAAVSGHGRRVRGESGQQKRRELRRAGLLPPSFPANRETPWKKRLDGEVVPRPEEERSSEETDSQPPTARSERP